MKKGLKFLDLFAGAGGLSEGFIDAGFVPVAHVEIDPAASFTLRTRMAYHWLNDNDYLDPYIRYLKRKIDRHQLYASVPEEIIDSVINKEIGKATISSIFSKIDANLGDKKLDLIVGGPPCQAYSIAGRARDENRMVGDKRNYLYTFYAQFLDRYKPRYFVFENVLGLYSARDVNGNSYLEAMLNLFRSCGYHVEYQTLSAEDYGVLQRRKRIIIVGRRGRKDGFFPQPDTWSPNVTVQEVFRDLPEIGSGEGSIGPCKTKKQVSEWRKQALAGNASCPVTMHQARTNKEQDLEIYRMVVELWNQENSRFEYNMLPQRLISHKNDESFLDRFKVVAADLPYSHTVVAHIAKDGHYYIHPDIRQNRSITPREAARIQTFPDDYFFESASERTGRTAAFKQIGNAVPVLLARKIAEKLMSEWK